MFHITPAASNEILASAGRSDAAGMALRIAARRDAQGEVEFGMGFDEQREDDERAHFHGLDVLVGAPSRALLGNTVLDFAEVAPGEHGFVFMAATHIEPQGCSSKPASTRGGCGSGGCGSCG